MLEDDARRGLEARLEPYGEMDPAERQGYFDRLDFETEIIINMGFPGYFLIVADFINWAKNNGYKLVQNVKTDTWQLFDLLRDPDETTNLRSTAPAAQFDDDQPDVAQRREDRAAGDRGVP